MIKNSIKLIVKERLEDNNGRTKKFGLKELLISFKNSVLAKLGVKR